MAILIFNKKIKMITKFQMWIEIGTAKNKLNQLSLWLWQCFNVI